MGITGNYFISFMNTYVYPLDSLSVFHFIANNSR